MSDQSPNVSPGGQTPGIQWPPLLAVGIVLLTGLIDLPPVSQTLGQVGVLIIYNLIVILSALTCAHLALLLWKSFSRGEKLSEIWGGIAAGLVLWLVGEFIWGTDQLLGGVSTPSLSSADLLWVIGYLPFIWALVLRIRTLRTGPNKGWHGAVLIAAMLPGLLVAIHLMLRIINDAETPGLFEKSINLLYPLGDFSIAFLALLLMLVFTGGALSRPWTLISAGFLCAAVSDLLYGLTVWQGTYQPNPVGIMYVPGLIIDMLYVSFYALIALGLFQQARMQNVV